jgi:hypothetical protein
MQMVGVPMEKDIYAFGIDLFIVGYMYIPFRNPSKYRRITVIPFWSTWS